MTPAQQSRREALAKRVRELRGYRSMEPWGALTVADWIIAEQERREGPLVEMLASVQNYGSDEMGALKARVLKTLAAYRALDAPPQRTLEDVLREWNDRAGPLEARAALAVRLLDELAAALKRAEGERNAEGVKRGKE